MLGLTVGLGLEVLAGQVSVGLALLLVWLFSCALAGGMASEPVRPASAGSPRRLPGPE